MIFEVNSLDSLVESLFEEGLADAAAAVAELGVECFPTACRVHNRLGKVHWRNGRVREALAAYRKSLEINPKDNEARAMLDRLEKKSTIPEWPTGATYHLTSIYKHLEFSFFGWVQPTVILI